MIQCVKRPLIAIGLLAGILIACGLGGVFKAKPVRIPIGPSRVAPQISVNYGGCGSIYILAPDGSLWGLGINSDLWSGLASVPHRIGTNADWQAVAGTPDFLVAMKTNGTLWQWGHLVKPYWGQVGTETNWAAIAAGGGHVIALRKNGTLWAWGQNDYGQLGSKNTGPIRNCAQPQKIGSDTNWVSIAAGVRHSLALRSDGSLWAWGQDSQGKIQYEPVQVGGETNWVAMGAGDGCNMGVKRDGSCWSWVGLTKHPNLHSQSASWIQMGGGLAHNLALEKSGSLWGWGMNQFGELGDGTKKRADLPKCIGKRKDWIAIGASYSSSAGLTADGTLWGWGQLFWQPAKMEKIIELMKCSPIGSQVQANMASEGKLPSSSSPEPIAVFVQAATK